MTPGQRAYETHATQTSGKSDWGSLSPARQQVWHEVAKDAHESFGMIPPACRVCSIRIPIMDVCTQCNMLLTEEHERQQQSHAKPNATQWFKLGDHPAVTMHKTMDEPERNACLTCEISISQHGSIEIARQNWLVCPGDFIITSRNGRHRKYSQQEFLQWFGNP